MSSIKKPTEVYDVADVCHFKPEIQSKYLEAQKEGGKWLMFVEKSELDQKWEEICKLYDKGVLDGIYLIKCSTSYKNPRAVLSAKGCIRFYCGPASDEEKIMAYGRNLLKWIKYEGEFKGDFMYYKTDEQSKTGTRALGQKINHTYGISLPGPFRDDVNKKMENLSIMSSDKKPTEIYDALWVYHFKPEIKSKYLDAYKEMGKWMMFIKKSELDKKWEEVCKFYDQDILNGICQLKCSTNYENPRSSDHSVGVIMLYCGPASDEKKIIEYGTNVLKLIEYEGQDFMYYKTDEQSRAGTRLSGQKKNYAYRVAVPKAATNDCSNNEN